MLGVQQAGSDHVDFGAQAGVYLLYDQNRVVYVGRSQKPRLGNRLRDHTKDRLSARWNRFSWFGVRSVGADGALGALPNSGIGVETLIATMEALLIEGLEPPQNRRQGDGFVAVEFIQAVDPKVANREKKKLLLGLVAES
ncbi:GIY-YIG nuclease family protein [Ornithinimicrobium ciconiae]|uniref:GIY-YIG nuclease family protein n=1 Tax=Ornithinimicrobium ciconiae TaxID=2594265 RepID=A0A516GFZ4_9MICO|nr:GIY-YIG nuclease family protein [Ornithinimicrobium ciconiae]